MTGGRGVIFATGTPVSNSMTELYTVMRYYDVPREIKYGFIAIVKEALHNIVRHSDASKVKIVMREHPALYQLIVEDNGTVKEPIQSGGVKAVSRCKARKIGPGPTD